VKFTYLLDTNTFSYIASGKSQAARVEFRRLADDPDAQLCISVFTEAEVRFGMNKRALSPARRAAIEGLLANLEILPWGSEEAAVYAKALPELQAQGIGVSLMDFLIGIHAATTGSVLVTHDKVFSRIAMITGISATVDWAQDV
jgi:tRNA(fMet)-specific endonuclease VapC